MRSRPQALALLLMLALLALLPLLVSDRWLSLGYAMFITAIAVIGLQICTGYAGQVNLGQSAFMGVGAYACALFLHLPQMPLQISAIIHAQR